MHLADHGEICGSCTFIAADAAVQTATLWVVDTNLEVVGHFTKVMRRLTADGILDAKKGHHGGFILAKPPSEVRFIDILRAVDFEPTVDHCLFGLGNCDTQNPCPLHSEWSILKGQIEQWARSHSLGDSLKVES